MCRMSLAIGDFSIEQMFAGAVAMSQGKNIRSASPIQSHQDGWGMVWGDLRRGEISSYKCADNIADSFAAAPLQKITGNFLAIHIRHATLKNLQGQAFVHPITGGDENNEWYLMHNGYLPSVHRELGMAASLFDSQEYYDYLVPSQTHAITEKYLSEKIDNIKAEGEWNAANALLISAQKLYMINWTPEKEKYRDFLQLYQSSNDGVIYFSSEPLLNLSDFWQPLRNKTILSYTSKQGFQSQQLC